MRPDWFDMLLLSLSWAGLAAFLDGNTDAYLTTLISCYVGCWIGWGILYFMKKRTNKW